MVHRGILTKIEDFSRNHWGIVFAVFALLTIGALALGRSLKLDADILAMLPQDDPEISTFRNSLTDFGSLDYLLVMFEAPEGGQAEDYTDLAERFAEKVTALPQVEYVEYRLDENSPIFELFEQYAPLYLNDSGVEKLQAALTGEAIHDRVRRLRGMLENPSSIVLKQWIEKDPLGLAPIFLSGALGGHGPLKVDLTSGYYLSQDGRALLMIVKPDHPPQDIPFAKQLKADVDQALADARAELRDESEADPYQDLQAKLGGGYIIAIEDSNLIKSDLKQNALISFLAVTGLYLFCYRRIAAIVYSTVPLLVGQALTFGVAILFLGGLNSATAGFTAMLMGLGTDFTIVMYGRYIEERRKGASLAAATHRMMGETALGVFTGAITSAGTFGALCVSHFPGLRGFGFLVAIGILLCLVAILFLLPAMIAWNEGKRSRKGDVVKKLYLHSFGVERLLLVADRFPKSMLAISVAVTVIAASAGLNIELSDSYRDLRSPNNSGFLVQEEISQRFGGNFNYMVAIAHGKTEEEVLDLNRKVVAGVKPWVAKGDLAGFESIVSYLPDDESQKAILRKLDEGQSGPFSVDRVTKTFKSELAAQGFREDAFNGYLDTLPNEIHPRKMLTLADLQGSELAKLVDRYLKPEKRADGSQGFQTATFLFPADRRWSNGPPAQFIQDLTGGDARIQVTGLNVVGVEIKKLFRTDAVRALLIGMLIVGVLLLLDFRSLRLTIYGLVQLSVGVVWMLGLMKATGIQMNFVNAFATTMILGVGIDYGIHLIHRIWEERSLTNFGVQETGKAVVMAALTNVGGFGTVALSNFPGIRSMGLVCLYGTVCCLLTSLTLLPALLKLFPEPKAAPAPAPEE